MRGAILLAVSGARADRAEAAARRLAGAGCRMLVSYGVCGGLDPDLAPGTVLRPSEIVDGSKRFALALGDGATVIAGSDAVVPTPRAKTALRAETGAAAVDMESHAVARVAAERGLPVAALRAVGDGAETDLPPFAAHALGPDGRPRLGPVLAGLIREPRHLGPLLRLRRDTNQALRALEAEVESGALDRLSAAARSGAR